MAPRRLALASAHRGCAGLGEAPTVHERTRRSHRPDDPPRARLATRALALAPGDPQLMALQRLLEAPAPPMR